MFLLAHILDNMRKCSINCYAIKMAARTRGLQNKEDKKKCNFSPSREGRNCTSCYKKIIGKSQIQGLERELGSGSSTSQQSILVDPSCRHVDESDFVGRRTRRSTSLCRTTEIPCTSNTLNGVINRRKTHIRKPTPHPQTRRVGRPRSLVLEYGLDCGDPYAPPDYHLLQPIIGNNDIALTQKSGEHFQTMASHVGLLILMIVCAACIFISVYILLIYFQTETNDYPQVSHMAEDKTGNVQHCHFSDLHSERPYQYSCAEDHYREVDVVQLTNLMKKLEHLQERTEIFRQEHIVLQNKVKQIITVMDSIKEPAELQMPNYANFQRETMQKLYEGLALYDADKLGLPDFALESSGGNIISTPDTKTYGVSTWFTFGAIRLWNVQKSPRNIIQASVLPGDCWAFEGSTGKVIIELAMPITITSVTMEHISPTISLTGTIDSAPNEFVLYGLHDSYSSKEVVLGRYIFSVTGPPRQTFHLQYQMEIPFKAVKLWILSNHGNPEFTCVYRFRVHGQPITNQIHNTI